MRRLLLGLLASASVVTGGLAVASPAWAATCALGANNPTTSMTAVGGRYNCSGTVTLTVRLAKHVAWDADPYSYTRREGFSNGTLSHYGKCLGINPAGEYYTWTISSSGNQLESGRVSRCG